MTNKFVLAENDYFSINHDLRKVVSLFLTIFKKQLIKQRIVVIFEIPVTIYPQIWGQMGISSFNKLTNFGFPHNIVFYKSK